MTGEVAGGGGNPIIPNRGVNDPHIHVFGDKAYLYASHDASPQKEGFVMRDWHVWSSRDLVYWTHCSTLHPADTFLGDRPNFVSAWATDASEKDGRYYWYFSDGDRQIGVVTGESACGPWSDPLGRPLIAAGTTPTMAYDPAVFAQGDERYLVFGCWNYHIAKLGDDMISLAEEPRELVIRNAEGPYTFAADSPLAGKLTDDKAFLHKRGNVYYLSWGVYYATSGDLYGPYDYRGVIVGETSFPTGLDTPTWPLGPCQGRHGSFFDWHGQSYFAFCDISQTGNRYFRDTFVSYVHYRRDGTIAPIRVDRIGVGNYDAASGPIDAGDFFSLQNADKQEREGFPDRFVVVPSGTREARACYPHVRGLAHCTEMALAVVAEGGSEGEIEVLGGDECRLLGRRQVSFDADGTEQVTFEIGPLGSEETITISWRCSRGRVMLERFWFR